jgi:DNA-binding transcriptional MerR regulator
MTSIFYECGDVARILRVCPNTVRLLVKTGVAVPTARTLRGTALFDDSAVEALIRIRNPE